MGFADQCKKVRGKLPLPLKHIFALLLIIFLVEIFVTFVLPYVLAEGKALDLAPVHAEARERIRVVSDMNPNP